MSDQSEKMREFIERRVGEGFDSEAEIVTEAIDYFSDGKGDVGLRFEIERLASEIFSVQGALERGWSEPTDCDRLDDAFAALERSGVIARQNFTCCQTCGHYEIWDEVEKTDANADGYVFFHMQDTESAYEGHGLYLAYGSTRENEEQSVSVALRIVCALREAGLVPEWDGDVGRRIYLPMNWKRRRFQQAILQS